MKNASKKGFEFGIFNLRDSEYNSLFLKEKFAKPVWTTNGEILLGLSGSANAGGYWGYPAYWDIQQGQYKICKDDLPFFAQIQTSGNLENPYEVILHNAWFIVLFDLIECEQTRILVDYSDQVSTYELAGFSYNPETKKLSYGLVIYKKTNEYIFEIRQLDLDTQENTHLAEGISPSWSPDGTHLAYIGENGLYTLTPDNNEITKFAEYHFFDPTILNSWSFYPIPHWSPDNNWIVYHRCNEQKDNFCETSIYRINLQKRSDEKLYSFGEYPSWRP